ncbi:MAG TPA: ATP-binding protein [Pyrinomonadaceae bacterium]
MSAPVKVNYTTSPPESEASTLQRIVELVRRIMQADVSSVLSYSLADDTVKWKAASGFQTVTDYEQTVMRPLAVKLARQALDANTVVIFEGIGLSPELAAENFPVHVAEGIHDLAIAPLRVYENRSGALTAGYRRRHRFTEEEKRLLQDLAEMAAVALNSAHLLETVGAAEKIWEQTFDAIDEGVVVYDDQMRIIRCNGRAAEMIEMPSERVAGMAFEEALTRLVGKEAASYYLAQNRDSQSAFEAQTQVGRRYLISIHAIERPNGRTASVASWKDVTRLSEMQEQLARSRRLGSVGQLAAGVAHEINNPLAAIATCADAIMRDLRGDESLQGVAAERQWHYYLEEIVRQAMRCKDITAGLLDLTQQRQARRALCDINMIARQCAKGVLQQSDNSRVEFEISLDENIGEVATDAAMVRQVLDNLLSNAVDALGEEGGRVTISTAREGERAVIEVADTGQGIAADLVSRVFDPFVSTKGPGKNYGLGLAICAALAESLGGGLAVLSKQGQGSRFRLWIPRRAPEKQESTGANV